MIDLFALALVHGLLLIAALRLLTRDDLDEDAPAGPEDGPDPAKRPGAARRAARRAGPAKADPGA